VRHLLVLCALVSPAFSIAQTLEIPDSKLTAAPKIDGVIGEIEWKGAAVLKDMVDKSTGAPAPEQGQFWIAYDESYIYFAGRLGDSSPSLIRATEYQKNVSLKSDDSVGLYLDLSGTAADFNLFEINPKGATSISLAGGRAAKREWAGDFTAQGRITESGWEFEARVPWQILSLPGHGKRNLRVNFTRTVARTQRSYLSAFVTEGNFKNTPVWKNVEVPAQEFVRTLKLLPYIYAGYDRENGHVFNSGLDLKTQISDQIELVGTINPDFRNIENQILSLDFSRFERLAGETRPFFQEGRQYIGSALFASQRIDNFDVGVNTYGRISNKTTFGLLDTVDWDRRNFLFGQETRGTRNNFVGTFTHDPDPNLQLRLSVSSVDRPDLKNDAYLLRATKTMGDFSLQGRDLASRDSVEGYGRFTDLYLNYQRNGWQGYFGWNRATPEFNPRLGFFPDRNFLGWEYGMQYNKNFDKGTLNDWGFFVGGNTYDHIDGSPYRHNLTINPFTTFRGGFAIVASASLDGFGDSNDTLYGLNVGYPRGNVYRNFGLSYQWGNQAGFDYKSISGSLAYRTLGKLQTSLRMQHVEFNGKEDQAIFSASYDLGHDRSVSGRMVREQSDTNVYVALRQSGNLGTEYFLILGDPNARKFRSSLILKVTMPFEIALSKVHHGAKETISKL
jgi:hypothetical protein